MAFESVLRRVAACIVAASLGCGSYHGTVVDAETGEPLAGAVITMIWCRYSIFAMDRVYYFHNAREAVADARGQFAVTAFPGIDWGATTHTESRPEIAINMVGYWPVTRYSHENLERELLAGTVVRLRKLSTPLEKRGPLGLASAPSPSGTGQFLACGAPRDRTPNLVRVLEAQRHRANREGEQVR